MVLPNDNSQSLLALSLSAFGLMADLYDFGIVNVVRPTLEIQYGKMTPHEDALVTGSALLGSFVGMIVFGAAADHLGRRCLFIITATLVGIASLGSALSVPCFGMSLYSVLIFWRFLLGLGIGGEYPLAASFTAETTDTASSSLYLALTYAGMGAGGILAPCVVMLMAGPLGVSQDGLWRYALGFGAVLALVVALLRFAVLRETRAWEEAAASSNITPRSSMAEKTAALLAMRFSLVGTAGTWFLYNVVTFGTGLYSTTIFAGRIVSGLDAARIVLYIQILTAPGWVAGVALSSSVRMKYLMMGGLSGMMLLWVFMILLFDWVDRAGWFYLFIFSLQRCVDVSAVGVASFVIPGQIYPTRIRASGHGISAASGKAGAVIGTSIFPILNAAYGMKAVFAFMATTCAVTLAWARLFTPLYDASALEEISKLDSSMGLVPQARKAESIVFGVPEKASLLSGGPQSGKDQYGAQDPPVSAQ